MADTQTPSGDNSSLKPDEGEVIPRLSLKETGFSAIKATTTGKILEEANSQFRFPNILKVVSEMKYSPPVQIGLQAINTLMNRSDVTIIPLVDETAEEKQRRDFLFSVLHDMENTWQSTLQSISTYKEYGFQISEMVFRRRLKRNGSAYDDGLIGLKGLKNRPQNSIKKWNFSEDGRQLLGVSQSLENMPDGGARFQSLQDEDGYIKIPREKFALFRCDPVDDNPEGQSCLRACYLAYKQLSLLSDNLMVGVAKDIAGIPYVKLDPRYMAPDAKAEDKAVYEAVKAIVDNVIAGKQAGIVFPSLIDENGNDKFSFSLLEQKSGKAYDIPAIIAMLQANILAVLAASSVGMGSSDAGSLSLQDSATNMLALTVSYRLSEISNTLNKEVVPMIWKLNGWSTERMPKIAFKDISSVSIEEYTKGAQRLASTSQVENTRAVFNKHCEVMGWPLQPDDKPIDKELLPAIMTGQVSGASEGMATGTSGSGTAKNAVNNGENTSDNNADNKG